MIDPLFQDVSLTLYHGDCVALLGRNGIGKSTLLNIVMQNLVASDGEVIHSGEIAMLSQQDELGGEETVLTALLESHTELSECYNEIAKAELEGLPDPMYYADVMAKFTDLGGFDLLGRIEIELTTLGFEKTILERSVHALSGGERRLLKLVNLFVSSSDLLIFDEPTNYLDEAAILFLIEKIRAFEGACLIVSHDRWFLDQTVSKVLELEHGTVREYQGNYTVFRETKDNIFKQKLKQKDKLESEISKLEVVERTYKIWGARKEKEKSGAMDKGFIGARAARLNKRGILAKERITNRIKTLKETKPHIDKHYSISFPEITTPSGSCVLVQNLSYSYGDNQVLDNVSISLTWGERFAIVGANGSGKSTLIKVLLGKLLLGKLLVGGATSSGTVLWAKGSTLGYLPQLWDVNLNQRTIAELFSDSESEQARLILGALHVKGHLFDRKLETLSEGQKQKVRLVRLMLDKPNILIFDEPTTHLDYQSIEMLEAALRGFSGTLVLVSHDRYLREALCNRELKL